MVQRDTAAVEPWPANMTSDSPCPCETDNSTAYCCCCLRLRSPGCWQHLCQTPRKPQLPVPARLAQGAFCLAVLLFVCCGKTDSTVSAALPGKTHRPMLRLPLPLPPPPLLLLLLFPPSTSPPRPASPQVSHCACSHCLPVLPGTASPSSSSLSCPHHSPR